MIEWGFNLYENAVSVCRKGRKKNIYFRKTVKSHE